MARRDGMPQWRKSSRSASGNCVELWLRPDEVKIRDSRQADGAVLSFGREAFDEFLDGVKRGDFDRPRWAGVRSRDFRAPD